MHKPAWQSGAWLPGAGAESAVDGLYKNDVDMSGGQCAESGGGSTAEWRVDLRVERSIHHIVIHYATGSTIWGTVCFKVYNIIH